MFANSHKLLEVFAKQAFQDNAGQNRQTDLFGSFLISKQQYLLNSNKDQATQEEKKFSYTDESDATNVSGHTPTLPTGDNNGKRWG